MTSDEYMEERRTSKLEEENNNYASDNLVYYSVFISSLRRNLTCSALLINSELKRDLEELIENTSVLYELAEMYNNRLDKTNKKT